MEPYSGIVLSNEEKQGVLEPDLMFLVPYEKFLEPYSGVLVPHEGSYSHI